MKPNQFPSGVNFNRLLKDDILWLYNHRCGAHQVRYSEHPRCFLKEFAGKFTQPEKIGFLDIETTNLHATFGYVFCYSLKLLDGELIHHCCTPEEIKTYKFDKRIIQQFVKDAQGFDRLVVYWGKDRRFDLPFLRTRALHWKIPFPLYKEYRVTDVYDLVRNKCCLHRNRLENIADVLKIPAKMHRMDPDRWNKGLAGHLPSLQWIQLHCDEDAITLEGVFKEMWVFGNLAKSSI